MNVSRIHEAIQLIPQIDFDQRAAAELISALEQRILRSTWAHQELANVSAEHLQDAFVTLDNWADDIDAENAPVQRYA